MFMLIVLVALGSLLVGLTVGWYLRRIERLCPQCGDVLSCAACRRRPAWSLLDQTRRPAA
ncbi:MAG: hypothetical protein E6F99_20925 [Actinobacteria bacterium]|nr:MAG: hypothetical protein E6F99_20925 [Actinomycetota bacterium]